MRRPLASIVLAALLSLAAFAGDATTKPTDWREHMVTPALLWPNNFLSGKLWQGQGLTKDEVAAVLNRRLPPIDKSNVDAPLLEVAAKTAGRAILWIPALSGKQSKWLEMKYGERPRPDADQQKPPPTVGDLLKSLTTFVSEVGGPDNVTVIGERPNKEDHIGPGPYLIYTVYVTRDYIAIVALPVDDN